MRELRFRAWDDIQKKILHFGLFSDWAREQEPIRYGLPVMQYTGLKDKNGKEIYEGDILQVSDIGTAKIIYGFHITSKDDWGVKHGTVGFTLQWIGSSFEDHSELWPSKDIEIIGNIYENPELLEKK